MEKSSWPLLLFALFLFLQPFSASAREGMYPMHSTEGWPTKEMTDTGMHIPPEELLTLRQTVAKVAHGGTGSFVSSRGLLVTNHHVAYRCIAALDGMPTHSGIMEQGFLADQETAELSCPGYDLLVVDAIRDVTESIRGKVSPKSKGHRRFEAIRLAVEDLEAACREKDRLCTVDALDGGRAYHMMVYRLIRDGRLVYAPPKDIGKFGGDVDNWRYPRHTGDFAFLRAYVDPSGKAAPYSGTNLPYNPPVHLVVSGRGVAMGDFVSVIGFPARTKRNFPSASARFAVKVDMPKRKQLYRKLIGSLAELSAVDQLTARRYQALEAGLMNAIKYYDDSIPGFARWKIIDKLEQREKGIRFRLQRDQRAKRRFGRLLPAIDKIYKRYRKYYPKHFLLERMTHLVKSLGTATDIVRWTDARLKPDRERTDDRYKTRNIYRVFDQSDNLDDQITLAGERALLVDILGAAQALPHKNRIRAVKKLLSRTKKNAGRLKQEAKKMGQSFEEYFKLLTGFTPGDNLLQIAVDLLYSQTELIAHGMDFAERERALFLRRRLFFNDVAAARSFRDPLLDFARELAREVDKIKKGPYRQVEETFDTELRPSYAKLIRAPYPDANFQARLSFGVVDNYVSSADGKRHRYLTDLAGVLAKDKGAYPFRVPPALKAAAKADKGRFADPRIGDVPVNFTTTLDTTGGNSGSPVLDADGKLVGLLFDGTPESVLSDWQFLPDEQRSICVDIRYALFLADKVAGAQNLLSELGFGPDSAQPSHSKTDAVTIADENPY